MACAREASLVYVRDSEVERLDLVDAADLARKRRVEARARQVALVVVGRNGSAALLDL